MQKLSFLSLVSALALFTSPSAWSTPREIKVLGVTVLADEIGYYVGSQQISDFVLTRAATFPLARGNQIFADNLVYLNQDGSLSAVVSDTDQTLSWKSADGRTTPLFCGKRPASFGSGATNRVVTFYPGGEYKDGCSLGDAAAFTSGESSFTVAGDLYVDPVFHLLYASRLAQGRLVFGGQAVQLQPGSEISLFPSGVPNFFTLVPGATFVAESPNYGKISVSQGEGRNISTILTEGGMLERGILAQDLVHRELGFKIPKGSGIAFDEKAPAELIGVILMAALPFQTKTNLISIDGLQWDADQGIYSLRVAAAFTFQPPTLGSAPIAVPVASVVQMNPAREIVGILVPKANRLGL